MVYYNSGYGIMVEPDIFLHPFLVLETVEYVWCLQRFEIWEGNGHVSESRSL